MAIAHKTTGLNRSWTMDTNVSDLPQRLLVVSRSARMLARSAARAGLSPVALDLYGDADTRESALVCEAVAASEAGFDPDALLAAAARLAPAASHPLVYGSGLDVAPDLLERLAEDREVLGNAAATVRLLKAPREFFALLRELGIAHPETRFSPPDDASGWLVKAGCGEGGRGVRFAAQDSAGAGDYFQRWLPGESCSALFLADGANSRVLGFNTLWSVVRFGRPFMFAGALNRAKLTEREREQVRVYVARMTRTVGLRGLNSLDFVADGEVCRVLEINPRPSATMGLYDADFPAGLLAAHVRACRGRLDAPRPNEDSVRACAIVFAPRSFVAPESVSWPEWCADRPAPGVVVEEGGPLCTVEAEGRKAIEVEALTVRRRAEVLDLLFPCGP